MHSYPGAIRRLLASSVACLGVLTLFALTPASCAAATTYYVSPSGNDNNAGTTLAAPFLTIQAGINNAATGDTVSLAAGTYTGPGNVDLDAGGKSITVTAPSGAAATIIDCGGTSSANHRAFYYHSNESAASINGLTIKNSYEGGNTGGAVCINSGCTATLTSCTFSNNTAQSNSGNAYGGGISNHGTMMVTNCTFTGNAANVGGGGIGSNGTMTLMNCSLSGNTSNYGGGVYNGGTATLTGCTSSSNFGDGIDNGGVATVTNCITNMNLGRGIDNGNVITLTNCTLNLNIGGFNNGDQATLTNCTFNNNTITAGNGGGVYYSSNSGAAFLKMTGCTVTNNMAVADSNHNNGAGGGVYIANPATTLTNCTIGNNTAYNSGGGVYNRSQVTLTNCLVTGNTSTNGSGGGIYNSNQLTLQFCTLVGNSTSATVASTQGGALENDSKATIIDTILWGNTALYAGEIGIPASGSQVTTATYCDIQGGYSGTGNIHADPLFVSTTDFHVQPGSPCLGAGLAITGPNGVTTDLDGNTRDNPPSMGAYEVAEAVTSTTHVLWDNTNGTAALWNYSTATGAYTAFNFGPYSGWTAKAIADGGTDSKTRMLWNNTNGTAALWNVAATGSFTTSNFGPYTGWTANAVSVGSDNTTHLLWTNTSGKAALWNVVNGQYQSEHDFGPYSGWTAKAIADGTDGKTRILWTNTNGQAAFWDVTSSTGAFSQFSFGPYSGWTAKAVSVSATTTHVLWSNTNGTQSVWNYNPASGAFTSENYGPYSGWSANAIADGGDGKARLLWNNVNGTASFWSLDNSTGLFGAFSFGPYGGWTAVAISSTP